MNPSFSEKKKRATRSSIIIGMCLMVALFLTSRIAPAFAGAQVVIEPLPDGLQLDQPVIDLSGMTRHAKTMTINGTAIPLTLQGAFDYTLVLHPGYNSVTFDLDTVLGKKTQETYAFILQELDTGTFAVSSLQNQN